MKPAIKYDTLNEAEANATKGEVIVMFTDNKFAPMYPNDVAPDALRRGEVLAVMYDAADEDAAAWEGAQFSTPVYATKFEALTHCLVPALPGRACGTSAPPMMWRQAGLAVGGRGAEAWGRRGRIRESALCAILQQRNDGTLVHPDADALP
jgi:hypothetical protein